MSAAAAVVMAGPRVALTEVRPADLPRMLEWINDRALVELSAPFKPVSPEAHRRWFESVQGRDDLALFAIREVPAGRLIGSCQLRRIDPRHHSAELTIRIGEADCRGRGLGTEAVRLLVAHGFAALDLNRICLHVFADNQRAVRAYEKAGFVREGLMRQHSRIGGAYKDAVLMALLREDFRPEETES
ncbi:MAG: GNAT family N-acetyltransferase [Desulfovibrionaceae bacterium]